MLGKTQSCSGDLKDFYPEIWGGVKKGLRSYILQIGIFYSSCHSLCYSMIGLRKLSEFKVTAV